MGNFFSREGQNRGQNQEVVQPDVDAEPHLEEQLHQDLNVELGLAIDMHPENVEKANEMEHNHPELAVLPEVVVEPEFEEGLHQDLIVELGLAIAIPPEIVEQANRVEQNRPELVAELPNAVLPESPPAGGESRNPPIAVMVEEAFDRLKKRNGISLEEICTYLQENCIVSNVNKTRPFVRRYLAKKVSQGEVMEVGIGSEIKYKRVPIGKKIILMTDE